MQVCLYCTRMLMQLPQHQEDKESITVRKTVPKVKVLGQGNKLSKEPVTSIVSELPLRRPFHLNFFSGV